MRNLTHRTADLIADSRADRASIVNVIYSLQIMVWTRQSVAVCQGRVQCPILFLKIYSLEGGDLRADESAPATKSIAVLDHQPADLMPLDFSLLDADGVQL
jgi:hypothetical protein